VTDIGYQISLWRPNPGECEWVTRGEAEAVIAHHHYLRRFPTGWIRSYRYKSTYVVFSISANKNLEPYLFSSDVGLRELSRLWAPDGHEPNELTQAIATACSALRRDCPDVEAVVSFADPNVGHHGGVYQAASWLYVGSSEETRSYVAHNGRIVARRSFHSGEQSRMPDLPASVQLGKHRYVRALTRRACRLLRQPTQPYPKNMDVMVRLAKKARAA
jgi:hypothetical protein